MQQQSEELTVMRINHNANKEELKMTTTINLYTNQSLYFFYFVSSPAIMGLIACIYQKPHISFT